MLEKSFKYKPTCEVLTLEQCAGINKSLFTKSVRKSFYQKDVIDKIENNFEKGLLTEKERAESIEAFNRITKSNFIRREGKGDDRRYIYKDYWI
jgi:alpha-galactosidase/6-phospho-beta-glucosidase family protein